jgi:hypothetical protein
MALRHRSKRRQAEKTYHVIANLIFYNPTRIDKINYMNTIRVKISRKASTEIVNKKLDAVYRKTTDRLIALDQLKKNRSKRKNAKIKKQRTSNKIARNNTSNRRKRE